MTTSQKFPSLFAPPLVEQEESVGLAQLLVDVLPQDRAQLRLDNLDNVVQDVFEKLLPPAAGVFAVAPPARLGLLALITRRMLSI